MSLARGTELGQKKGELLGEIKMLQELLRLKQETNEELLGYELSKLTALSQRLQKKLHRH